MLSIIFVSAPAFSTNLPDEQYLFSRETVFPNTQAPDGWFGVWFSDKPNYPSVPLLQGLDANKQYVTCSSINQIGCKDLKTFNYVANYPFCSNKAAMDCIDEVFAIDQKGKKIVATNVEYLPKNPTLMNSKSNYHPGGSSKEIFDLPGVIHKGGSTKYAIEVMMSGSFTIYDRTVSNSGSGAFDPNFFVNITPVDIKTGSYALISEPGLQPKNFDQKCVVLDIDRCGMAQGFPTGYKFGVSIRMQTSIYGWLHGRIQNVDFGSEDLSSGKKLTITGYPMTVPSISGGGDYSTKLTPKLQEKYKLDFAKQLYPSFDNFTSDRGTASLEAFMDWAPVLGDKATVMPSVWSFRNIKKDEFLVTGLRAGRCIVSAMKKGIGGMVSTNATVYSSGPPNFNEASQSLDYRVAAPHFNSQGEVFRGYYNLKITAETSRCIYDFKPIPMQATISILTDSGESIVGTTVVKADDEWVELTAANFEFSSPIIRVKFSNEISKVEIRPSASPSTSPVSTSALSTKKKTVLCLKGKSTKKISGVNPRCPSGYKKVSR